MALFPIIEDGENSIGQPPPLATTKPSDGLPPSLAVALYTWALKAAQRLNGLLSFGTGLNGYRAGNFDAQFLHVQTPVAADEEFEVPHGLKRVPVGYLVVDRDKPVVIYSSNRGGWTAESLFLRASATFLSPDADARIVLMVF